jgi:hypothetical protein
MWSDDESEGWGQRTGNGDDEARGAASARRIGRRPMGAAHGQQPVGGFFLSL